MFDQDYGVFNLIANLVMIAGGIVIIYGIFVLKKQTERLESVLAPKVGIEGFLNMCASVIEADPDGTCVVADDGSIVLVNKRFEDISGYHRSELIDQQMEILVPDAYRQHHASLREGFIMSPSSRAMRGLSLRHKRGKELNVGIRLNRYVDQTGGYTVAKVRLSDGS